MGRLPKAVRTITCDLCDRRTRCANVTTDKGHQIDLCAACLTDALAAIGRDIRARGDARPISSVFNEDSW